MNELFVDTNVFLRFLTEDVPEQAQEVERLLQHAAAGGIALSTSILVVAEIIWTLESYYELPREEIGDKALAILNTPGSKVENANTIALAVSVYVDKNIDFIDACNAPWARENDLDQVLPFDTKHFSRVEGIRAKTPEEALSTISD
jgi:predicted nucleic-acid-binding protein